MSELEETVERLLFSGDPTEIAEAAADLLRQTQNPKVYKEAVNLLSPKLDYWLTGGGALRPAPSAQSKSLLGSL